MKNNLQNAPTNTMLKGRSSSLTDAMTACRESALTEIIRKSDSFLSQPESSALSRYRDQVMAGNREGALWKAGEVIFGKDG